MEWTLIYNDGVNITTANNEEINWNDCPAINVQFLIITNCKKRRAISGKDTYRIKEVGAIEKTGLLISNEEFRKTRNFMIYGDKK